MQTRAQQQRQARPLPGYEVNHIEPLCSGGADVAVNMQWLTREEHRAKSRIDVMRCRRALRALSERDSDQ